MRPSPLAAVILLLLMLFIIPGRPAAAWEIFFDKNGVPMVNYGSPIGLQYNPVTVSIYALYYYGEGNTSSFSALANWLAGHFEDHGNYTLWYYNFSYPYYNNTILTPHWYSSMAQGLGTEVMLRAWQGTKNSTFLRVANTSLDAFTIPVELGGVFHALDNESWWYLDYASPRASYQAYILNEYLFALYGIYAYKTVIGGNLSETLWQHGLNGLRKLLPSFDSPANNGLVPWSYYAIGPSLNQRASDFYHRTVVAQLDWLYKITHDYLFLQYQQRWAKDYLSEHPLSLGIQLHPENNNFEVILSHYGSLVVELDVTLGNGTILHQNSDSDGSNTLTVPIIKGYLGPYIVNVRADIASPFPGVSNTTNIYSNQTDFYMLPPPPSAPSTPTPVFPSPIGGIAVLSAIAVVMIAKKQSPRIR